MELYWLLVLSHLHVALGIIGCIMLLLGVAGLFSNIIGYWDEYGRVDKIYKSVCFIPILGLIILIIACLCPNKTDLAIMLGWDAIQSDSVQEVIEMLKEKIR